MDQNDKQILGALSLTDEAIKALRQRRPEFRNASDAKIAEILAETVLKDRAVVLTEAADHYIKAGKIMMESFGEFQKVARSCRDQSASLIQELRDKRMALTTEMEQLTKAIKAMKEIAGGQELKQSSDNMEVLIQIAERLQGVPQHTLHVVAEAMNRLAHNA